MNNQTTRVFITGSAIKQRINQLEAQGDTVRLFDEEHRPLYVSDLVDERRWPLDSIRFHFRTEC